MKAIVYEKYGSVGELALREVPTPEPKPDQVLIRIRAVSLNDWDWQLLQGVPFVNRMMSGLRRPGIKILGCDVAGVVQAAGHAVTRFKIGDEVYGDLSGAGFGGFAEYVAAPETALAPKPPRMTFEQAAATPQAAMLAVQGLFDVGRLRAGQTLLVNGAAGGVGTFAAQMAKPLGVAMTGVDSAQKSDLMRSVGYAHVIDYQREDFTAAGKRYDLILDTKTNRPLAHYLRALNPGGSYVTVGGETGKLMKTLILGPWIALVHKKNVRLVMLKPNKDLARVNELFEAGTLAPVIDGPYTLERTAEAMQLLADGRHKGKVVVRVAEA